MDAEIIREGVVARLILVGNLDYSNCGQFRGRAMTAMLEQGVQTLVIDFARVAFVDSLSLGTLLVLREYAIKSGQSIELVRCSSALVSALKLANFHKLFTIR